MTALSARLLSLASFGNLSSSSRASTSKRSQRQLWSKLVLHALAVSLLVLGAALPSLAATDTVTSLADDGSPGTLRAVMAVAAPGDTIVFSVTGTITLTQGYLEIGQNLTIRGPGAASLFISGANTFTVFQVDSGVTAATISGVTIENGYSSPAAGGGINNQGTLTVSNSILSDNNFSADGASGGAIFNGGTLTVSNSILSDNSASNDGAGIFNSGMLTVSSSTLSGNDTGLPGASGAGIYNSGSGTLTVSKSTLSGNEVHDGGEGGAIFNGGTLTVSNSTLSGNSAFFGTGAGIFNSGMLTVSNSTLSGNSAVEDNGGAIFNGGTLTVSNSTLSDNSASDGGEGGAIFNGGTLILKSTLLAGQSSGGNCHNSQGSNPSSDGYNLSDDSTCSFLTQTGDQNNSTTAGLSPSGLQNNGGPTQTIALTSSSTAVDAIPLSACTDAFGNSVTTDQRGIARPQGPACDIGAFELAQSVAFSSFSAKLDIVTGGPTPGFDLNATLTLGPPSKGINPLNEPVTLKVGTYNVTLPAGSFKLLKKGRYAYQGTINGVSLQVQIVPLGGSSYQFKAEAMPVTLARSNPVTVTITIGDDTGTKAVTASFN
jgi:hypothetical protein